MNNKAFTISLMLAGMAVFMIYSYITSKEEEINQKYGINGSVVVAKRDIKEMDEIHSNMIDIIEMPKQFIEPGKVTAKEEVAGFIAMVPIRKGEQITLNKVAAPGVKTGLSRQVSPGKRAIALDVSDSTGVNRLIKPGDRIDVIAPIDSGEGKRGLVTKIVLQDAPVLAVGEYVTTQAPRKVEKDDSGKDLVRNLNIERNYNTITIEVDPQTAVQLAHLREVTNGRFVVVLRNNDDTERVGIGAVNTNDILGADAAKVIRAPAQQR